MRLGAPRADGHTTHVDMYAYAMPKYIHTYIHTYIPKTCQPNSERFNNLCVRTLWRESTYFIAARGGYLTAYSATVGNDAHPGVPQRAHGW